MHIYRTPNGKWAVTFLRETKGNFDTQEEAFKWVLSEIEIALGKTWEFLGLLARELAERKHKIT